MQSGLVEILMPLKRWRNSLAASRSDTIYSRSIAVKLPPKKAISEFFVSIFPEFIAVCTAFITSSLEGLDVLPVILRWSQKLQRLGQPAKGTKIETFERLIAHQLQCNSCGLLFCFFFASAATFTDGV